MFCIFRSFGLMSSILHYSTTIFNIFHPKRTMVRLSVDLIDDSIQYINPIQDRELNFRGCKIPAIENLGACRDKFDTIDFSDNDIRKLDNLPLLSRLKTLLFHNNRIQQIQTNIGEMLPNLTCLVLTNCNLCEPGDLTPLATLSKLEHLSLIGNPVTHKPQYRHYMVFIMPALRVLDFKRIRMTERTAAQSMFKGKKGSLLRKQMVKKSQPMENDEPIPVDSSGLPAKDVLRIKEAISGAKSLREVENLQNMLKSGHIPGTAALNGDQEIQVDEEAP